MVNGSFMWAGATFLFFVLATTVFTLILSRVRLAEGEGLERALTIAQGYVGETNKEEVAGTSSTAEVRAIFWKNWKFGFFLYIGALLLMHIAPNMKFAVTVATGILILVNAGFMGYTIALLQQLELGFLEFLVSLLPHGILEYAALYSTYGHTIWLVGTRGQFSLTESLVFMGATTVILLLAAFVEVNITSRMIKRQTQVESVMEAD